MFYYFRCYYTYVHEKLYAASKQVSQSRAITKENITLQPKRITKNPQENP